jgi:hypothetical protein
MASLGLCLRSVNIVQNTTETLSTSKAKKAKKKTQQPVLEDLMDWMSQLELKKAYSIPFRP